MDQRRDLRFKTRFDALYSTGPAEGAGVLADLSYAGARLEDSSLLPEVGTNVRLYVFIRPVAPFELEGRVLRHTERGFAIRYDVDDEKIRQLVDDVSGLVG